MDKRVVDEQLKEVIKKIVKEFQPEKIILFGSWAWGEPGPDSDVDLFIVKKTNRSTREVAREIDGSLWGRTTALDIIVYTPEELKISINKNHNLFIEDVIRNGKVLYAKPESGVTVALPQRELAIVS